MFTSQSYVMILLLLVLLAACASPQPTPTPILTRAPESNPNTVATIEFSVVESGFLLTSPAFKQEQPIPEKYSCKGEDISPLLTWTDPPQGTQSFALIMDDPDAPIGTWDHWIVFNIPASLRELPENMSADDIAAVFGNNSWKEASYGGPCPPSGTHRYFFKLYALDTALSLPEGASKDDVLDAAQEHTLAIAELMGTFSK